MVKTKSVYEPAATSDGYRVLVMHYWPRGVAKDKIDVWEKQLGTPPELIKQWKAKEEESTGEDRGARGTGRKADRYPSVWL